MGRKLRSVRMLNSGRSDAEAAYRVALRALAARPRSTFELRQRLRTKGHPPQAADAAIVRLGRGGYLDDHDFARNFVEVRVNRCRQKRMEPCTMVKR